VGGGRGGVPKTPTRFEPRVEPGKKSV